MSKSIWIMALVGSICVAGCQPKNNTAEDAAADGIGAAFAPHNRYTGIGVYSPGERWTKMVVANPPKDATIARIADDEHVIVVVDGKTGEVRQCGDLSGYCIAMNPWSKPLLPGQRAPIALTEHAPPLASAATSGAVAATSK